MAYEVELTERAAQPVLSIRTRTAVGNMPAVLGQAFGAVAAYLQTLGEVPAGAAFVGYYNMDMNDLDIEIGFPVGKPLAGKDAIGAGEIPGGKQVRCRHRGPYDQVGQAYEAMARWIEENGYTPTGVAYEFYFNGPGEVPESELLTEVVFPLR